MSFLRRVLAVLTSLPGRILVSAGLLSLIVVSIDWGTVGDTISAANWGWFALAVALVFGALAIGAIRWFILLRAAEVSVDVRASVRAYLIGAFSNNFLPTAIGGEFVRGWLVGRSGAPLVRALTSVVVDRVSALACLLLVAWLGVAIEPEAVSGLLVGLLAIATAAMLVAGGLTATVLQRGNLGTLLPRSIRGWAAEAAAVLRGYGRDGQTQVRVLVLGIGFQLLMVGAAWMLSEALGLRLEPSVVAAVAPLVLIATLIPISLAGFGVREGAYIALLGEVGVSAADAALFSLINVAALAIATAPGAIALAIRDEPLRIDPNAARPH